jgi:hypothetical protein
MKSSIEIPMVCLFFACLSMALDVWQLKLRVSDLESAQAVCSVGAP